jgi:WD40 repeat protein
VKPVRRWRLLLPDTEDGNVTRVLLAAGTATYKTTKYEDLDGVPQALARMVSTLTGIGVHPLVPGAGYLLDPSADALKEALIRVAGAGDVVIVYYTGHGEKPDQGSYYLVTSESGQDSLHPLSRTGLKAQDFVELLRRETGEDGLLQQPSVLLILDCCFSGNAAEETLNQALRGIGNPNLWMIASAGPLEYARQGLFADTFTRELGRQLAAPQAGASQKFLSLDQLVGAVNRAHHGLAEQRAKVFPPGGGFDGIPPPFIPNRAYRPGLSGLTVAEQHWRSKLRGTSESTTTGYYLTGSTGRVTAAREICRFIVDPAAGSLAVVTGSPGTGKSAMLALPVFLADPQGRDDLMSGARAGSLIDLTARLLPERTPIVAVHAHRLNTDQAAAAIGQGLGLAARTAVDLLESLNTTPLDQIHSPVIVVDALDEATSPTDLLTTLLLPLTGHRGARILLGSRRHPLDRIPAADLTIDLDAADYRDPEALTDYIHQLLTAGHEPDVPTPYRAALHPAGADGVVDAAGAGAMEAGGDGGESRVARILPLALRALSRVARHRVSIQNADAPTRNQTTGKPVVTVDGVAASVAQAIATKVSGPDGESFLLARLFALTLRARPKAIDTTHPGWRGLLPADLGAAFDEDLMHLGTKALRARVLLQALAWARGPGLPWANVWIPVAQHLAEATHSTPPGGQPLSDEDVGFLLEHAGAYIIEDLGPGGRSVYRPFHELLATYLRSGSDIAASPPATAQVYRQRHRSAEIAFTEALLGTLPATPTGRRWSDAHPYLRTYLAEHAHASGQDGFTRVLNDAGFLASADPATLTPLLTGAAATCRDIVRIYRYARPLLGSNPGINIAGLQESALALTGLPLPIDGTDIHAAYRASLASATADNSVLLLTGHASGVKGVAFGTAPDGGLLLASASYDGSVLLWDAAIGRRVGDPLFVQRVTGIALGSTPEGRLLLASTGQDESVRVWDTATGHPVSNRISSWWRSGVALGTAPDGRLVLAVGNHDKVVGYLYVRLFDAATGRPLGGPLISYSLGPDSSYSVAVYGIALGATSNGQLLLASGCGDGTVRLWDVGTQHRIGDPLMGHTKKVAGVAFGTTSDGGLLLATASDDRTVRLWDIATGNQVGDPLIGHKDWVTGVAFGTAPDGRLLLASASRDKSVKLWDAATGHQVSVLTGHTDWVTGVAFGTAPDGRLLLASASSDCTVRMWDTATTHANDTPLTGHSGRVNAVAFGTASDGRLLVASASSDKSVKLWDIGSEHPTATRLSGHKGEATGVAFGTTRDGRLLVASASSDKSVRLWDATTGKRLWDTYSKRRFGHPVAGHTDWVTGVAFGTTPDGELVLASASADGSVRLWDTATGHQIGDPLTGYTTVAFGTVPDGRLLLAAAGSHQTLLLWDVATRHPLGKPLIGHMGGVTGLAFSTVGGRLLLASASRDGTVCLWDIASGNPVGKALTGHTNRVTAVAFGTSRNGRLLLASASEDRTVRLWDGAGRPLLTIPRREVALGVAFHNQFLAIGCADGLSVVEPALD